MSTDLKYSKELVELRRNEVLRLVAQAVPQNLIAQKLNVSPATVSLDMQYLRCMAQENLKTHIEKTIPIHYTECQAGLQVVLRKAYDIVETSTRTSEVLDALSLIADIYGKIMDLSTNGAILEKTVNQIKQLKEQSQRALKEEEEKEVSID